MNAVATDWDNNPAAEFTAANFRVLIGDTNPNKCRASWVYNPSQVAQDWDGVKASHAIGSRFGGYFYCNIERTGRGQRFLPGCERPLFKARITLNIGTIDEETVDGWIVE